MIVFRVMYYHKEFCCLSGCAVIPLQPYYSAESNTGVCFPPVLSDAVSSTQSKFAERQTEFLSWGEAFFTVKKVWNLEDYSVFWFGLFLIRLGCSNSSFANRSLYHWITEYQMNRRWADKYSQPNFSGCGSIMIQGQLRLSENKFRIEASKQASEQERKRTVGKSK